VKKERKKEREREEKRKKNLNPNTIFLYASRITTGRLSSSSPSSSSNIY